MKFGPHCLATILDFLCKNQHDSASISISAGVLPDPPCLFVHFYAKMERAEYRSVIKFLVLSGKKSKAIIETLHAVYGPSAPSAATIKRWVLEVKRGRPSLEGEPRSGRPATAVTPKIIDTIDNLVRVIEEFLFMNLFRGVDFQGVQWRESFMTI